MKASREELADPPAEAWDAGYRGDRIDTMLLLADDDEPFLLRRARQAIDDIGRFATVLVVERGAALRNEQGEASSISATPTAAASRSSSPRT